MPKSRVKLREIERLRALAVLTVVYSHLGDFGFAKIVLFASGWPGVDLFFVISGFVIANSVRGRFPTGLEGLPLAERFRSCAPSIKAFYVRRFYRIAPLAITWLVVPLILSVTFNR